MRPVLLDSHFNARDCGEDELLKACSRGGHLAMRNKLNRLRPLALGDAVAMEADGGNEGKCVGV